MLYFPYRRVASEVTLDDAVRIAVFRVAFPRLQALQHCALRLLNVTGRGDRFLELVRLLAQLVRVRENAMSPPSPAYVE